ncbi:MAG: hypothetical protein EBY21_14850 [Alphaproteobacteria bacterium]|nr:hypothetical protein [Alphaproteobacteria bacterium]
MNSLVDLGVDFIISFEGSPHVNKGLARAFVISPAALFIIPGKLLFRSRKHGLRIGIARIIVQPFGELALVCRIPRRIRPRLDRVFSRRQVACYGITNLAGGASNGLVDDVGHAAADIQPTLQRTQ